MPRISTDNYDTVAAWNGSQDLFVVEQPDGTKVATPAMVKHFIEAGDFEATGEIIDGHGNILKDMAKSADVDAEIGDLSQTGLTGDSVAAQLAAAKDQIAANAFANIVQTKTVTGTTNGYGDVQLGLNNNYLVLSVIELSNDGGCFVVPRMVISGAWWATVYRQNAKVPNTAVSLRVQYVQIT